MFRFFVSTLMLFSCHALRAQNFPVYSSFFNNPYLYNPAEAATEYTYAFANFRKQWVNVPGAPTLATLNVNTLIDQTRTGVGFKASSFKRGLLTTSDFYVSASHGIPLNKKLVLHFGISGGLISNSLDVNKITDPNDPAISNYLANNLQPAANAGIKLTTLSGLNLGIALPQLFSPAFVNPTNFSATRVSPFDNMLFSLYYKKKLEPKGRGRNANKAPQYAPLEMYLMYRLSAVGNNQLEVVGKLNLSDHLWLAASYRQQYGFIANTGFAFDRYSLSYSYEFGGQPESGFSRGSHEIQLGVRLSSLKQFRYKVPELRSRVQTTENRLDPRYRHQTMDEEEAKSSAQQKKYYVVIRAFPDLALAEDYAKKLIKDKFNAKVFFYQKDKKYYVYVFETTKAGDANKEAKELKTYTKLKGAKVLIVTGNE